MQVTDRGGGLSYPLNKFYSKYLKILKNSTSFQKKISIPIHSTFQHPISTHLPSNTLLALLNS